MKKLLIIPALFIVLSSQAQTYKKIEVVKFNGDKYAGKTVINQSGKVSINAKTITIENGGVLEVYHIVSKGSNEPQDEGFYAVEYVCTTNGNKLAVMRLKLVAFYSPKNELADLIVKTGSEHLDYCIID
jgi:hypothetical protein